MEGGHVWEMCGGINKYFVVTYTIPAENINQELFYGKNNEK